jgi:hypothetical protein
MEDSGGSGGDEKVFFEFKNDDERKEKEVRLLILSITPDVNGFSSKF